MPQQRVFTVYVLHSSATGRLYIGQTNDLARRLREHQQGHAVATRGRGPWQLVHARSFETRLEAVRFERHLKALKQPSRVLDAFRER